MIIVIDIDLSPLRSAVTDAVRATAADLSRTCVPLIGRAVRVGVVAGVVLGVLLSAVLLSAGIVIGKM